MTLQLVQMAGEAFLPNASQATPTLRETLKRQTENAHRRLHEQRDFQALRAGRVTVPAYVGLLVRLLGLHAPIEELLAPFETSRELAWYRDPAASRAFRLRMDLRLLGYDAGSIDAVPRADALLPPLRTASAALGCAWVIEGSALGGKLLAPILRETLGIGSDSGGAFLAPLPSQGERWRACCAAIEAQGVHPWRRAEIVAAAEATFAAFADWIEAAA